MATTFYLDTVVKSDGHLYLDVPYDAPEGTPLSVAVIVRPNVDDILAEWGSKRLTRSDVQIVRQLLKDDIEDAPSAWIFDILGMFDKDDVDTVEWQRKIRSEWEEPA